MVQASQYAEDLAVYGPKSESNFSFNDMNSDEAESFMDDHADELNRIRSNPLAEVNALLAIMKVDIAKHHRDEYNEC
jgi:hypothetical protein